MGIVSDLTYQLLAQRDRGKPAAAVVFRPDAWSDFRLDVQSLQLVQGPVATGESTLVGVPLYVGYVEERAALVDRATLAEMTSSRRISLQRV